jgi:hypothetical protein
MLVVLRSPFGWGRIKVRKGFRHGAAYCHQFRDHDHLAGLCRRDHHELRQLVTDYWHAGVRGSIIYAHTRINVRRASQGVPTGDHVEKVPYLESLDYSHLF